MSISDNFKIWDIYKSISFSIFLMSPVIFDLMPDILQKLEMMVSFSRYGLFYLLLGSYSGQYIA